MVFDGSQSRSAQLLVTLLAVATLGFGMAGCGGETSAPAAAPAADESVAPGAASTDGVEGTESAVDFVPEHTFNAQLAVDEGQDVDLTIEVGDKFELDEQLPTDFMDLQTACDVDSQTDVLVPVRITVENPNDRFDASVSPMLKVADPSQHINLQLAEGFDDGPSCADSMPSHAQLTVSPGGSMTHDSLVVIGRYFTPANPEGNQDLFEELVATVGGRPLIQNLNCMSGPGSAGGYFSLAGADIELDGENRMPEC